FFNASVSLTSARGVIVFADYQLLAAMGTLIEYLKAPPPVDAAPVDLLSFGLPGYGLPTLRVNLPQTGSEPLHVPDAVEPQPGVDFKDRWGRSMIGSSNVPGASEWLAQQKAG